MPQLQLKVIDDLSIDLKTEIVWDKSESNKSIFTLTDPTDTYFLDLETINKIKMIVILSNGPFTVSITKDYITNSTTVDGVFLYTPDVLDRGLLDTLEITPHNSTPTVFTLAVYGEE